MYIAPDTTLKILHNIPLDKTYENTVFYKDKDSQYQAFNKYVKFTLDNLSYQRSMIGSIRVELPYEDLYDCNYLMFKNSAFENKWFYCFITGTSYISNTVTEIYYIMDVMQTWCYDYTFLSTFVQRRHSDNDVLYENTQPEGLELGSEYYPNQIYHFPLNSKLNYILCTSDIPSTDITKLEHSWRVHNALINNVYTGLYVFGTTDTGELQQYLQAMIDEGKEGAVVSFYMAPTGETRETHQITITQDTQMGGYTPRNKKLYTSPFNRLCITNNAGMSNIMKFEYFNGQPTFEIANLSFPQAVSRVKPVNYNAGTTDADQAVVYVSYPICGFAGDAYKAWFAANKNSYVNALNTIGRTYDTNMQIARNNYSMAQRNANLANENTMAGIATDIGNTQSSYDASKLNSGINLGLGVAGGAITGIGGAMTGDASGAFGGISQIINSTANYITQQNTANTNLANAQNTAGTNQAIAQRNLTNALQNAALTMASTQLSGLTAKQNAIDQLVAKKQDIQNIPDSAHGNALCDAIGFAEDDAEINVICQTIKPEYAKIIDSYFDMFGYAQNRLYTGTDLDNRINRPHYSYIRTMGCSIKGKMNQADIETIKGIYDNGITTWDTLEDIGNYELDNKPTTN